MPKVPGLIYLFEDLVCPHNIRQDFRRLSTAQSTTSLRECQGLPYSMFNNREKLPRISRSYH